MATYRAGWPWPLFLGALLAFLAWLAWVIELGPRSATLLVLIGVALAVLALSLRLRVEVLPDVLRVRWLSWRQVRWDDMRSVSVHATRFGHVLAFHDKAGRRTMLRFFLLEGDGQAHVESELQLHGLWPGLGPTALAAAGKSA